MRVYFVRHAETIYNAKKIHQPAQAPLSLCGVKQAEIVAKKFLYLPVDVILTSSNLRAQQTAKIINRKIRKPIISAYQLRETRRPTQIVGKKKNSRQSKKIADLFYKYAEDEKWYFSDEENFLDLVARAQRALKYISHRKEQNLLVVTHSTFIKLIICTLMFQEELTPEIFRRFIKFFSVKNTGITMCEKKATGKWRLITWNDYGHLSFSKNVLQMQCNATSAVTM